MPVPYPSNSVTETLITAIENLGGPAPTSYGLGELLRDFDDAIEDFTGGGGGSGVGKVRLVSANVGLNEYTIFAGNTAEQVMTLPVPTGHATNIVKNSSGQVVGVGGNINNAPPFGFINLNPGDSVILTWDNGSWFELFPQNQPSEPVYNVVDYGADPTEAADSTAAIQGAINTCGAAGGGVVYFPPGSYQITETLQIGNGQLFPTAATGVYNSGAQTLPSVTAGMPIASPSAPLHLCIWLVGNSTPIVVTYTGQTSTHFTGITYVSGPALSSIVAFDLITAGTVSTINNVVLKGPASNTHSWFGALGFGSQAATIKWAGSTGSAQMVQFNGPITGGGIQNLFFDCNLTANGAYYTLGLQSGFFENVWVQDYYANGFYYTGVSAFFDEVRGVVAAGDSMFDMTRNCGGLTNVTGRNTNLYLLDGDSTYGSSQSPNATYSYIENPIWTSQDPGSGFTNSGLYFRGCDNIKVYGGDFIASQGSSAGTIAGVVFDFTLFGGNTPQSCMVDGLNPGTGSGSATSEWLVVGTWSHSSDPNIVTNIRGGATEPSSISGSGGAVKWLSDTVNGNYGTIGGSAAGGDLSGTYPNPTVAAIDGISVGGAWVSYTPAWTAQSTNPSLGNGTLTGFYQKIGRMVAVRICLTSGSTTTFGSGAWFLGLPFTAAATSEQDLLVKAYANAQQWAGTAVIPASSTTAQPTTSTSATDTRLSSVGAGNPAAWAASNVLVIQGVYESIS